MVARTGYEERFPEPANRFVPLRLGRDRDLWRCPSCGALFLWVDMPQVYGSGNLDEESLTRLDAEQTELVRALHDPALYDDPDVLAKIQRALVILPGECVIRLMSDQIPCDDEAVGRIVPTLVALSYEGCSPVVPVLQGWCHHDADRLRRVLDLLVADPRPRKGPAAILASRCLFTLRQL